MELFDHLALGFSVVLTPQTLLYCLMGVTLGTLVGVLPGVGPLATIAVLLPFTFNLPTIPALIMLAGIYYGSQYGGSTTAILLKVPGESSAVVACLDGHEMARQGRAGPALGIAALGSFFAGTVATVVIALFAPPLVAVALEFGATEFFSLMVLGLVSAVVLAHGDMLKAVAMVVLGLIASLAGIDTNSGETRFAFGSLQLAEGLSFVIVALGMFGFAEIITNLERHDVREPFTSKVSNILPTKDDIKQAWKAVVRGTALGAFFGVLPGTGATISAFASYSMEKKIAKDPSRFGKGAIEGLAGPESANNSAAQTAFIPMLTLGLPASATMAVMLGALMLQGINPGPQVMTSNPELFWGIIVSMWVGNLMLVVLNLPMIGIWIRLLTVPYRYLYPAVLIFACIGTYSVSNSSFDILMTAGFAVFGFICAKLECEAAPFLLAFILGTPMEEHFRRALLLSRGDLTTFVTQPISAGFLVASVVLLLFMIAPNFRRTREEATVEE
ncbi:MAG: tripartite tricarboxylate transporter permease [Rhodospirillaceae bacterium]|jgi:putative tricarboxylic transport membrane protein